MKSVTPNNMRVKPLLASNNRTLTKQAWLLFADIRAAEGAPEEAKSLRRRWRNWQG